MAKKTTRKTPRMSASAARADGAAKQQRERDNTALSDDFPDPGPPPKPKSKPKRERAADSSGGRAMRIHRNLADKPTPPKRMSILDAASQVLADAKAPMQARQIVEAVIERGLWKPGAGKTPHATLYAAMTREIEKKGDDARFTKVDRGLFSANARQESSS